ncbi:MAG: usg protein [Alphaproteobacteria bacterium]
MTDLEKQLLGWRLTTAEIVYRMPDHPSLLQTFVWQKLDAAPRYPALQKFLDFWEREIEAKIHSVRVAQREIVRPSELRHTPHLAQLH